MILMMMMMIMMMMPIHFQRRERMIKRTKRTRIKTKEVSDNAELGIFGPN